MIKYWLWRIYAFPYEWIFKKYQNVKYATWGKDYKIYVNCTVPLNYELTKNELYNMIKNDIPYVKATDIRILNIKYLLAYRISIITFGRYHKIASIVLSKVLSKYI